MCPSVVSSAIVSLYFFHLFSIYDVQIMCRELWGAHLGKGHSFPWHLLLLFSLSLKGELMAGGASHLGSHFRYQRRISDFNSHMNRKL